MHHPAINKSGQSLDEIIDSWHFSPLQDFWKNSRPHANPDGNDFGKRIFFQEFSPIGQLIVGLDGQISYANPAARTILGIGSGNNYQNQMANVQNFAIYLADHDQMALNDLFLYLQQHPNQLQSLIINPKKLENGDKITSRSWVGHVKLTGRFFPTDQSFYFFIMDITAEMLSQNQLQWQGHLLQEIFDSGPEMMFTTSNGDDILNANQKFFQFFADCRPIRDRSNQSQVVPISNYFISGPDEKYLKPHYGNISWPQHICQHPNKQHIAKVRSNHLCEDHFQFFQVKIFHLTNRGDQELFLVMFLDITKQVEHENELEIKITQALAQHREKDLLLIQQAKMATLGEMMAAIAHQWRQPLNVLSLSLEILAIDLEDLPIDNPQLASRLREHISLSHNQLNYLSQTIEDFKNFFRKEQNKEHFSLISSIEATLKLATPLLQKNCISCSVHSTAAQNAESLLEDNLTDGRKIKVFGISSQLQQVILSMISNAIDALCTIREQRDGVKCQHQDAIAISTQYYNQVATITIFNPSPPLATETLEHIGELYFTTKDPNKGTGLGFYLSRLIIKEHFQGDLTIDNVKNGVAVTICLPASYS